MRRVHLCFIEFTCVLLGAVGLLLGAIGVVEGVVGEAVVTPYHDSHCFSINSPWSCDSLDLKKILTSSNPHMTMDSV